VAKETFGQEALISSDIVDSLGQAFCKLKK